MMHCQWISVSPPKPVDNTQSVTSRTAAGMYP